MNDSINNVASRNVTTSSQTPVPKRQDAAIVDGKSVPPTVPSEAEKSPPSEQDLNAVVADLNSQVQFVERNLQFSIDDNSGQTVVKVVNTETDELIRQIPSEDLLRIAERIREQQDTNPGMILEISA